MFFNFTCNGEDSTMTSYSYLREPSLQTTGYTNGMKTGSFNYLADGDINFKEEITYDYGNGTNLSISSVKHELYLEFNGGEKGKGISEFFGKGFFRNNRAISAWKKIRYEDLSEWENRTVEWKDSNYTTTLGKNRKADYIKVDAKVDMHQAQYEYKYAFDYKANVQDAVVETKDAAGWSNRTGMRRIDFEHDTLMSGDLNITNVLEDEGYFYPGGPGCRDWLPCCLVSGTNPPIEVYDPFGCKTATPGSCSDMLSNNTTGCEVTAWPNQGTYGVLSPDKQLPDNTTCCPECTPEKLADCYKKCNKYNETINNKQHCLDDCNETCINFTCTGTDCPGFECINTYEGGLLEGEIPESEVTRTAVINVLLNEYEPGSKVGKETPVIYRILIKNGGSTKLTNVTLIDHLPEGVTPVSAKYENEVEWGTLGEPEKGFDDSGRNTLTWRLSDLKADDFYYIVLDMKNSTVVDYKANKVNVTSLSDPERIWVNASSSEANLKITHKEAEELLESFGI